MFQSNVSYHKTKIIILPELGQNYYIKLVIVVILKKPGIHKWDLTMKIPGGSPGCSWGISHKRHVEFVSQWSAHVLWDFSVNNLS